MSVAIKVENLSKAYQLGQIGTGTISKDLERWYARIRGKEDPFLKIGETNDQRSKSTSDLVWSLKDINFEIEQGDAVGIIGRNGAGKSTLLKILSKVTAPTTGRITGKGRIASLLEVGTGFHPELSGRENVFLNGAILGMRKKEIQRKLEEIVDFAGIERYLDTPVKRYSSGMYVRLAFAVAAHLESEILIVDEVLAVGDAEFQKKCLGKMGEVSKGEGRTVLFVSHNMGSIRQLCEKGILLNSGSLHFEGTAKDAIARYQLKDNLYSIILGDFLSTPIKPELIRVEIDKEKLEDNVFLLEATFRSPFLLHNPTLGAVFSDPSNNPIFGTNSRMHPEGYVGQILKNGKITLTIPILPLMPGEYGVSLYFGDSLNDFNSYLDVLRFTISSSNIDESKLPALSEIGYLNLKDIRWNLTN